MIKLYHVKMSRSLRVRWLLEEMGLDYELVEVKFHPEYLQSDAFRDKNPLGKVPAMEDGEDILFESGGILEYLIAKYGDHGLVPKQGTAEWATYLNWFHGAETIAIPAGIVVQNTIIKSEDKRIPAAAEEAVAKMKFFLKGVAEALDGKEFLCGTQFTAADIMMVYSLALAQFGKAWEADEFPILAAYMARCSAREAFKIAAS